MYHSLYISYEAGSTGISDSNKQVTRNTWNDFFIAPMSRPVVPPPSVRTEETTLAGMFGKVDFSDILTGYPIFDNRQMSQEFIVDNGHAEWIDIYSDVMSFLHGKKVYMTLEDDPEWYYYGRAKVNSWKSDKNNSKITLDFDLDPFKYYRNDISEDWEWDSFNFELGVMYSDLFKNIAVDGNVEIDLRGTIGDKPFVPTFIVSESSNGLSIEYVNDILNIEVRKTFEEGSSIDPDYIFYDPGYRKTTESEKNLKLTITGQGTITILFRPAKL